MFPEPTELLLIGCWIEWIWTPRLKSNTLTPKTNSQTYWPRETSHVMNGIIFCVCSTLAISVLQLAPLQWQNELNKDQEKNVSQPNRDLWWIWPRGCLLSCLLQLHQTRGGPRMDIKILEQFVLKWCRKERKKIQEKKESQQNRSRWWIWSRDAAKGLLTCLLATTASESPGKTRYESQIPPSSWTEQQPRKNGDTSKGRLLIKLLRIECWRKMVFSRVEIWWSAGSKNGETCKRTTSRFVHTAHRQVCHWWRWYGL